MEERDGGSEGGREGVRKTGMEKERRESKRKAE